MYLARNPWGTTNYSGTWNKDSNLWTTANKNAVPFGLGDKVASSSNDGYFVIDYDKLVNDTCFDGIDIAYQIPGYHSVKYDYENAPTQASGEYTNFYFTPPSVDGDIYVTTYLYPDAVVPSNCYSSTTMVD